MMTLTPQQQQLFTFVSDCHGDQKRKYTDEPYTNHLLSVAEIVASVDDTPGLTEIALCHDLFEDTLCDYNALDEHLKDIGYEYKQRVFICLGVHALTDQFTSENYPKVNRATRKKEEADRLGRIDPIYQTVKLADLIDNSSSIFERDPNFAKIYLREKQRILGVMVNGNSVLYQRCQDIVEDWLIRSGFPVL